MQFELVSQHRGWQLILPIERIMNANVGFRYAGCESYEVFLRLDRSCSLALFVEGDGPIDCLLESAVVESLITAIVNALSAIQHRI